MDECPIPEFKKAIGDKVDGHHTTLYGKEGTEGIVGCVKKKVSRSFLMGCVMIMIGVGGIGYKVYSAGCKQRQEAVKLQIDSVVKEADLSYIKQYEHNELKSRTQKLETDMGYIKFSLEEIKLAIKELPDKLKE